MAGLAAALTFALGGGIAGAQTRGTPLSITTAPVIVGGMVVGTTLTTSGGAWQSPNPEANRTEAWWEWWRCPNTSQIWRCQFQTRNDSYRLTDSDRGQYVYLTRYVRWRNNGNNWETVTRVSATPSPVTTPVPTPAPTRLRLRRRS